MTKHENNASDYYYRLIPPGIHGEKAEENFRLAVAGAQASFSDLGTGERIYRVPKNDPAVKDLHVAGLLFRDIPNMADIEVVLGAGNKPGWTSVAGSKDPSKAPQIDVTKVCQECTDLAHKIVEDANVIRTVAVIHSEDANGKTRKDIFAVDPRVLAGGAVSRNAFAATVIHEMFAKDGLWCAIVSEVWSLNLPPGVKPEDVSGDMDDWPKEYVRMQAAVMLNIMGQKPIVGGQEFKRGDDDKIIWGEMIWDPAPKESRFLWDLTSRDEAVVAENFARSRWKDHEPDLKLLNPEKGKRLKN